METTNDDIEMADMRQVLTFRLGTELLGVDILRVQEIRGFERATRIPNTPFWVRGVINIRGAIVPVIDLRRRFGVVAAEGATTVVVLVEVRGADRSRVMGVVVDGVSDVVDYYASDLRPVPEVAAQVDIEALSGVISVPEGMVVLVDVDRLLGGEVAVDDDAERSAA